MTAHVVVGKRWKYMAFSTGATPEALNDLEADPGETRNLDKQTSAAAVLPLLLG